MYTPTSVSHSFNHEMVQTSFRFVFREQIQLIIKGGYCLFHPLPCWEYYVFGLVFFSRSPFAAAARSRSRLSSLNFRNAGITVSNAMTAVM